MSPSMLNRLKGLPLTIVLTVLIWMYAEAKFTATQDGVRVAIRPIKPDLALRAFDAGESRFVSVLNVLVTIEGPKNQVDRIYQESLGSVQQDEEFTTLNYTPPGEMLKVGTDNRVDTVAALNSLRYFRQHGVTVTSATPPRLQLEVDRLETLNKPVDFHPTFPAEHFVATPDVVAVKIPAQLLAAIGVADRITVSAVPVTGGAGVASSAMGGSTVIASGQQSVAVRYTVDYPGATSGSRDDRITVTPTQGLVLLTLPPGGTRKQETATVPEVPVWVSGPPALLAKWDVAVTPGTLKTVVAGPTAAIEAVRKELAGPRNSAAELGVRAYLDIFPEDTSGVGRAVKRRVRFMLPDGLTVQSNGEVEFRLMEKTSATQPAAK